MLFVALNSRIWTDGTNSIAVLSRAVLVLMEATVDTTSEACCAGCAGPKRPVPQLGKVTSQHRPDRTFQAEVHPKPSRKISRQQVEPKSQIWNISVSVMYYKINGLSRWNLQIGTMPASSIRSVQVGRSVQVLRPVDCLWSLQLSHTLLRLDSTPLCSPVC